MSKARMSPARRHFLKATAAKKAAADSPDAREQAPSSAYELMLAKLAEDRRRLKGIQSVEGKIALKKELIPDYLPWIEGVLEAGKGGQDAVLMTLMVWMLDAGRFEDALRVGEYALEHGLVMPDQYERNTATVLAEEFADQALKTLATEGGADEVDADQLMHCIDLVAQHDMPDQVRAKLHKAIGYVLREREGVAHKEVALKHLQRAFQLNDKAGVKKDMEVLDREVKKLKDNGDQS